MPVKPLITTKTNVSPDVLNAIKNSNSINYQTYVPYATPDADSIRTIGNIIMDSPNLRNEFISTLINRIIEVRITSKLYQNPFAFLKNGYFELGETIQEVFVKLIKPHQYDIETAEKEVWKREIPDVQSAFHVMNYRKFYKETIEDRQLRQAFLSWDAMDRFIADLVNAIYTSANYDEFMVMKYLIAYQIKMGNMYVEQIPPATVQNATSIVTTVKALSNNLTFMKTKYNRAGVHTFTRKEDQYIFINSYFEALMGVNVLATSFNMSEAEFMGRRILVDSFADLDIPRLDELFKDDPTYLHFTPDDLTELEKVPLVTVDRNYFQIYDNMKAFTEIYNPQGLYWNYFYHVWQTFSTSPFSNAVAFVADNNVGVNSITVSPSIAYSDVGGKVTFSATVNTTSFASQQVEWATSDENATITGAGVVTLNEGVTFPVTITARSVYDNTVTGTATIYNEKQLLLTVKKYTEATKIAQVTNTLTTDNIAQIGDNANATIMYANGTQEKIVIQSAGIESNQSYVQFATAPTGTVEAGNSIIIIFE